MMMRIAISGKMASGKSLITTHLVDCYGFTELCFAYKIKQVVADLFPRARYRKDRWLLIQIGELLRELDPQVWIRQVLPDIVPGARIVISDVRFPKEYEILRRLGFIIVRMEASYESRVAYIKEAYPDMPLILMEDSSEVALDNYPFDYIINNDADVSLAQVYAQVDVMMRSICRTS